MQAKIMCNTTVIIMNLHLNVCACVRVCMKPGRQAGSNNCVLAVTLAYLRVRYDSSHKARPKEP